MAQIIKSVQVNVRLFIVTVRLEEIYSLLNLYQHFLKFNRIFDCFIMVENIGAFFLIFVVLLMFLNFTYHACEHIFSIQDHHTCLLEIACTSHNHRFVDLNLSQVISILLQKFFLFSQIFVGLLDEFFELNLVARCLVLCYFILVPNIFYISRSCDCLIAITIFALFLLFSLKQGLDF